jgi:hypothetical protein
MPRRVALHRVGEFTGDIDILTRRASLASAFARGETELLRVSSSDVRQIIRVGRGRFGGGPSARAHALSLSGVRIGGKPGSGSFDAIGYRFRADLLRKSTNFLGMWLYLNLRRHVDEPRI